MYGVRGVAFGSWKWFGSYLSDRKQFVLVNGVSSDILDVKYSVPQDSALGPLMFLIFVNDFHSVCKNLNFICLQMIPTFTLMQKN